MNKRLILVLALAFAVGISFAAYAEVQNVKVSGDLTVMGVARNNFDFAKTGKYGVNGASNWEDKDRDILSITRVRIDADLTDNVIATVRLHNERAWNGEGGTAGQANRNVGLNTATANESAINLDLAYVTLKEFLYSPLSLKIGRQELKFGNGLIVGDPDTNIYATGTNLAEGDLSLRKGFDAVRATLDYKPLVLDLVYAKIQEGAANLNDDITLTGVNANYDLNKSTNIEGYMFNKVRGSNSASAYNLDRAGLTGWNDPANAGGANVLDAQNFKDRTDMVNVVGVRAVNKSVKNLTLDGQLAYQFGTYNPKFDPNARYDATQNAKAQTVTRSAWAAQAKAGYALKDIGKLAKYDPMVSAFYTYLSGASRDATGKRNYTGWDPMYEDQTEGHIINAIFANTNMHRGGLTTKAKLTDDITAKLDYVAAWFAKKNPKGADYSTVLSNIAGNAVGTTGRQFVIKGGNWIGQEIDATLTYDYTEDVQFSLLGGVLLAGTNIRDISHPTSKGNIASPTELIGSMKVTF